MLFKLSKEHSFNLKDQFFLRVIGNETLFKNLGTFIKLEI